MAADGELLARAALRFAGSSDGATAFAGTPGTLSFVALDARLDVVTGWCWGYHLVRPDGTSMLYLHQLEVAEDRRRQGIGRALLLAFLRTGAALGATKAFLSTGAANVGARRLYESLGGGLASQGETVNYWFRLDRPLPA